MFGACCTFSIQALDRSTEEGSHVWFTDVKDKDVKLTYLVIVKLSFPTLKIILKKFARR